MISNLTPDFYITQGDHGANVVLTVTLKDATGAVVDLTNVSTVRLRAEPVYGGTEVWNLAMSIVGAPSAGTVQYAFQAADTAIAQDLQAQIETVWQDGSEITFPTSDSLFISIIGEQ